MNDLQRPDGATATGIGWALIVVGVLLAFLSATAGTDAGWILTIALANVAIGLGVLLLSLGYLVKAIWFLPGREIEVPNTADHKSGDVPGEPCDWCGRTPAAGKPCSSFTEQALSNISVKVINPVCMEQLRQRGYPVAADFQSRHGSASNAG